MGTRKAGETVPYLLEWTDVDGNAVTGKTKSNLQIDAYHGTSSHNLLTGATLTEIGSGLYRLDILLPSTKNGLAWRPKPDATGITAGERIIFLGVAEQVNLSDEDSIAASLSTGTVSSSSALDFSDIDAGQVVDGDAWKGPTITVDSELLSRWGYSDLSAFGDADLRAAIKVAPADAPLNISAEFISAAANTLRPYWNEWPGGIASLGSDEQTKTIHIDVQLVDTGPTPTRILTLARLSLEVVWEREERTI